MLADYHVHTPYCGHAHGKTAQYVEQAIACGLSEIGFADHLGRYYLTHNQRRRYWDWGMHERHLGRYYEEIAALKEVYSDRVTIKTGLEIDFVEGTEELLLPLIREFEFDFFLGSVHCLPRFGWNHLADYREMDEGAAYVEYFRLARAAMESSLFQSLAHIDFIWRYIRYPGNDPSSFFEREIEATVRTAIETGTCIEINANGYLWSQTHASSGESDPFTILLAMLRQYRAPITLGSDAHDPAMVGKSFGEIVPVLRSWGITTCRGFTGGNPCLISLT